MNLNTFTSCQCPGPAAFKGALMKNYDSKLNPFVGAGILGIAVPVAVYAIGFVALLVFGVVSLLLFPFFYGGHLNADAFGNITAIAATVLQVLLIVILTLIISVFSGMKIYHVLLSAVVSSLLFFIVERFIPLIRWANFPEIMVIFPALFKRSGINYGSLSKTEFVELKIYLTTTLLMSAVCALVVLITWTIYQIAVRKKQRGDG